MALVYEGGVLIGADSRTASSYIADRASDKIDYVHERIFCLRSGSAADTQTLCTYVRYYIDIHILLEGSEVIGASPSAQGQRPTMDFDSERDYGLFEGITTETLLTLAPGDIALLFPGELHRPMGTLGDVAPIRKIVVKVANHLI